MHRLLYPGMAAAAIAAACVLGFGLARNGTAPANPEDGKVANGSYASDYFGLSYRLPAEWTAGLAGPAPSRSGYYVLGSWMPSRDPDATILIAAQDMFFSEKPDDDVPAATIGFRQTISSVEGMTIDREPAELKIGPHLGHRVDFSGVGLYRSMVAVGIRCHVVTFNLTARDPVSLAQLARSLDSLNDGRKTARGSVPDCIKDYAAGDNIVRRVDPEATGVSSAAIPVRLVVAKDGSVKHVHVIRATAAQRRTIEEALRQWKLKPYVRQGRAVEVETGVTIRFEQTEM
jgi:hypothetical protein